MYFRQRLLSLVNMGLHAVIIRLSPLILEGKQRCKPYIVGDPRMVSMSVTPPFEKSWLRPWCVHTSRIESLLNLTPLYTFVSKNVASVSDISAVNLMSVGWKLFAFRRNSPISFLLVSHTDLTSSVNLFQKMS